MDATDETAVAALFDGLPEAPRVVIYFPSARVRGPVSALDAGEVHGAVEGRCGTILVTGASAGVKDFPQSAAFAMGKFAHRGLTESMARELHPQGIHVAWVNIDGAILNSGRAEPENRPGSMLRPEAIARTYRHLVGQDRSAWTNVVAVSP